MPEYNGIVDSDAIGRTLLILGAAIAVIGFGVLLLARVPFVGKLPGDISFQRDGFSFFFPVVTCIILSVVLTIAVNVAIRIFR
jgi:hypothetical protein